MDELDIIGAYYNTNLGLILEAIDNFGDTWFYTVATKQGRDIVRLVKLGCISYTRTTFPLRDVGKETRDGLG
jgi:hypothetical protein